MKRPWFLAALLAVAACGEPAADRSLPTAPVAARAYASFEASDPDLDGTVKSGAADVAASECRPFCFLSPTPGVVRMRPPPTIPFSDDRVVTLLICESSEGGCAPNSYRAAFFTNFGNTRILVNPVLAYYAVVFRAATFNFEPQRLYRIEVFANGRLLGTHRTTLRSTGMIQVRFFIARPGPG